MNLDGFGGKCRQFSPSSAFLPRICSGNGSVSLSPFQQHQQKNIALRFIRYNMLGWFFIILNVESIKFITYQQSQHYIPYRNQTKSTETNTTHDFSPDLDPLGALIGLSMASPTSSASSLELATSKSFKEGS